jgi:serine/threonine protein kinase
MEYVVGRTLEEQLSNPKQLPLQVVLRLIQEVAEALHYSHQRGVIHRDVKPGNIMVTEEDHAKLADFGVAKIDLSSLTIAGQLFGTPAYMSPEQLLGGVVDGRSDLFSLGAVLYCMVAGYKPFQGNGASTVTFKVINREPLSVTAFDTTLPAGLDRIIRRALAKEPEQRYQSGAQMSADIQEVRDELLIHTKNSEVWRYTPNLDRTGDTAREASKPEHTTGAPEPDILAAQNPAIHPTLQRHSASKSTGVTTYLLIGSGLVLLAAIALSVVVSRFGVRPEEHSLNPTTQPLTSAQASGGIPDPSVPEGSDAAGEPIAADFTKKVVQKQSYAPKRVAEHTPTAFGDVHNSTGMPSRPPDRILATTTSANEQLPRSSPRSSVLDVVIDNHFVDAQLFVWIDDNLLLQDALHGEVRRSLVLFRTVDSENHRRINVPSGNHRVAVRVQSVSSSFDGRDTTSANFLDDRPTMLSVDCEGTNKLRLAVH